MVNVTVDFSLEDVHALYQAVNDAIEHWPGAPARHATEQEKFRQLKYFLFTILCEANYESK
jgi:hypothetical protein|tara:strand:- start:554 stop:736 length:183 start_codon:yes stop_codon:yes gene_type:complete